MRHLKAGRKLSRTSSHRKALFRNMTTSLLQHEHIRTTEAKAKELRGFAENMITLGKKGDLHARRQAIAFVESNEVVKKLFTVLADRYKDRPGGYTRVIKLENRPGDNAPMAIIELVDRPVVEKAPVKKAAKKAPSSEGEATGSGEKTEKKALASRKEKSEGEKKAVAKKAAAPKAAAKKAPNKRAPEKAKKG